MTFNKWLDTFVEEKGLNTDYLIDVEGENGFVIIALCDLLDVIKYQAPAREQQGIKNTLVKLDFLNKNVMGYFEHLAKALS